MSKPSYFKDFPNIKYAVSANKAGQLSFIDIKDYFHLFVVRDDVFRKDTLYVPYTIKDGERPDQISYNNYKDEQFYWVILQLNNITDYYTQWPLSEQELTDFVYEKYGGVEGAEEIHHWETVETFDQDTPPNKILDGGMIVPQNFVYDYMAVPESNVFLTSTPTSVTNYDYERRLNEQKSQIYILDPKYIYDYQREVRKYAKRLPPGVSFQDITEIDAGVISYQRAS